MTQMILSVKQSQTHRRRENGAVVSKGGRVGKGRTGNWGLADENEYM